MGASHCINHHFPKVFPWFSHSLQRLQTNGAIPTLGSPRFSPLVKNTKAPTRKAMGPSQDWNKAPLIPRLWIFGDDLWWLWGFFAFKKCSDMNCGFLVTIYGDYDDLLNSKNVQTWIMWIFGDDLWWLWGIFMGIQKMFRHELCGFLVMIYGDYGGYSWGWCNGINDDNRNMDSFDGI